MRRDAKADSNQPEVVEELRAFGALIAHTHTLGQGKPDFIVCLEHATLKIPMLLWVELKPSPAAGLTQPEQKFHSEWRGMPVLIAWDTRQIVRWFGYNV